MSRKFLSTLRLTNLTSDPSGGSEGDIYFNSITKALRFYNGSSWIELADTGIADQTQKYLMDHTHSYNGEISEIFPANPIYMTDTSETIMQYSENSAVIQNNPIFVFDGGSPTTFPSNPTTTDFTLVDGGGVV